MSENSYRPAPGGGKLYPYKGVWPRLGKNVFIAPGARIIGDVEIGDDSSIWFNCVLRADVNKIRIGQRSNIQDGSVVHVDSGDYETIIGDDVLIGHMAMVHGTHIEDRGFVGLGSITMDGCVIESDGMLAAGALLSPGKRIKSRGLWVGRPARKIRDLDDDALKGMRRGAKEYSQFAANYLAELSGEG